jgi:hypothetical protein
MSDCSCCAESDTHILVRCVDWTEKDHLVEAFAFKKTGNEGFLSELFWAASLEKHEEDLPECGVHAFGFSIEVGVRGWSSREIETVKKMEKEFSKLLRRPLKVLKGTYSARQVIGKSVSNRSAELDDLFERSGVPRDDWDGVAALLRLFSDAELTPADVFLKCKVKE